MSPFLTLRVNKSSKEDNIKEDKQVGHDETSFIIIFFPSEK